MRNRLIPIAILFGTAAGVVGYSSLAAQEKPRSRVGMMLEWTPPADRENDDLYVRGRAVAVGAAGGGESQANKPQACFTCHGLHGAADPSGAFPRIASQPAYYLYKQLTDYASGSRANAIMSPIAQQLSGAKMEAVAAYYAMQAPEHLQLPTVDPRQVQQGGALSAIGSAERGIPACVNCHGPSATGLPPTVPYLAGQNAIYTRLQFQEWKEGRRKNDPLGVMADIARRMSEADIEAVSAYLAHLPPPGPRASYSSERR